MMDYWLILFITGSTKIIQIYGGNRWKAIRMQPSYVALDIFI